MAKHLKVSQLKRVNKDIQKQKKEKARFSKFSTKQSQNLINKAMEKAKDADKHVEELKKMGIPVYRRWTLDKELRELEKYQNKLDKKGKLSWSELATINDKTKKNYYNDITRVTLQVIDEKRSTQNATITKSEEFTISKIEKLSKKELDSVMDGTKKGISESAAVAVKQWIDSTRQYKSENEINMSEVGIEGKSDDEIRRLMDARLGKGKIDLSWTGGMSSLLNDLHYIALMEGDVGRDLVQYISDIMQDKVIFAKIESYYQSSKGRDLRDKINKAVGKDAYDGIKLIYEAFDKLLDTLAFEGLVSDEQLEHLQEKTTRLASEALYGGEEIYY